MRKIPAIFAIILVSSFVFLSCSKDNDSGDGNIKSRIQGAWYEIAYKNAEGTWKQHLIYPVYLFNSDNTYYYYMDRNDYIKDKSNPLRKGVFSVDGENLSLDGGFKSPVVFSENGNTFQWGGAHLFEKYK